MTKRQLITVYGVTLFLLTWGLDLINSLKYGRPVTWQSVSSVFYFSQLIYITSTFILMRWIGRRFFEKKKYAFFILSVAGLTLLFMLIRYTIEEVIFPALLGFRNYPESSPLSFYFLDNLYFSQVYVVVGFLLFLLEMQINNQKKQSLLIQQNKEAELLFLRSQINPHFLFNTLNNIYSLVYEQSPKAPEAMLQLSELMRYVLYEKKETVPVAREWGYIQNFITLQQLRFDFDFPVELSFTGDDGTQQIPPYLLIPFIENAFKHGDFRKEPLKIKLQLMGSGLLFETSNAIDSRNKDKAGGIGLDNVRRRLELLYPGRYRLETNMANGIFLVRLLILPE